MRYWVLHAANINSPSRDGWTRGPFYDYKSAKEYLETYELPEKHWVIVKECYEENQHGAPVYPFTTEDYPDGDEG